MGRQGRQGLSSLSGTTDLEQTVKAVLGAWGTLKVGLGWGWGRHLPEGAAALNLDHSNFN